MENGINHDNVLKVRMGGEKIEYGILFGNEKIVFIKVGAGGNIRGYQDKYLRMAHRIHDKIGATVICASNPEDIEYNEQVLADKSKIVDVAKEISLSDYKVYMFGTSDGAYYNFLLAKEVTETVKILCVNMSTIDFNDAKEKLCDLSGINKILVYGDRDDEYDYVPRLESLELGNLEIITVRGADHEFRGMVNEFINTIDLIY
jgi:hypothetical protein